MRDIDEISGEVLDVALRLHRDLGPGLLESVYEALLAARLQDNGLSVERQKAIAAEFESVRSRRHSGPTLSSRDGSSWR